MKLLDERIYDSEQAIMQSEVNSTDLDLRLIETEQEYTDLELRLVALETKEA